jgi:UvrD/REP helicase N-terminal domain
VIDEARDCSTADLYILNKLYDVGLPLVVVADPDQAIYGFRGADTVLTGPLDRSALYGVLAEVEALGLDLVEVRQLRHSTNHKNHVTAAHRDRR